MNIKSVFLISILSIYIIKILWNIYLHSIIDDIDPNNISNFYKAIAIFNFILTLISLIVFHIYLQNIDTNKYTKYTTYVLFIVSMVLESIKIYVFSKSTEIINFNNVLRGITASLSAMFLLSLMLIFYVLKTNKVNTEVELNTFDNFDVNNDFDNEFDIDNELFDDKLEMELNNFNMQENKNKNKLLELENKNKELQQLLEKSNKERKNISFNI